MALSVGGCGRLSACGLPPGYPQVGHHCPAARRVNACGHRLGFGVVLGVRRDISKITF